MNIATVKLETLVKPDLKNFDERNVDEMLVKVATYFCFIS